MIEIERIDELRKEKGLSRAYIIRKLGLKSNTFFIDIEKRNNGFPEERLAQIADILDTTTDYLKGNTENKTKSSPVGEPSELEKEFSNLIRDIPEEQGQALLQFLKSWKKEQ